MNACSVHRHAFLLSTDNSERRHDMINNSLPTNVRRWPGAGRLTGTVGLLVLAVAASAAAPSTVGAEDGLDGARYVTCMRASASTPDALERYVESCRAVATAAYTECLRNAAGTPDAVEHWVHICAEQD
jgi:hypothetical protein